MSRIAPSPSEIRRHLGTLEATPGRLKDLTQGVARHELTRQPARNAWAAVQILAHLRACSDLWSQSIIAILSESSPSLAHLDERKWAKAMGYEDLPFQRSLHAFALDRAELVLVLKGLDESQWERAASIGGRRHTVFSQCRRMALHEEEHLLQVAEAIRAGRGLSPGRAGPR